MRRVRVTLRPQRAPIFVGCEGQSEIGYAGWLRNLVRDRDLPFHLELSDLGRGAADPGRAEQARRRAHEHGFTVIWQEPTHEAFLLRHFPGQDNRRPPDKRAVETALARAWPDYRKPCAAPDLEKRLGLDDVRRAAGQLPELAALLRMIGLLA